MKTENPKKMNRPPEDHIEISWNLHILLTSILLFWIPCSNQKTELSSAKFKILPVWFYWKRRWIENESKFIPNDSLLQFSIVGLLEKY